MIIHTKNILICSMVLFIVIFISTVALCQSEAQISIPFEIYDNAGGQKILYFGVDQTATDGIDIHLGESDLPPYPPTGAFDARWLLPQNGFNGSLSSWLDYRNAPGFPYSGTIEHRFRYQCMVGATEMYFKWDLPPEVTGLVQDLLNGTIINVPIEGYGTYQIINFNDIDKLKLFVYYNNVVLDVVDDNPSEFNFELKQNYPNPFNPKTTINFTLLEATYVTLNIYNTLGQKIVELVKTNLRAGFHSYDWEVDKLTSGLYIYELKTEKFRSTKKMVLMK